MTEQQALELLMGRLALPLVQGSVVQVGTPLASGARQLFQGLGSGRQSARWLQGLAHALDESAVGEELAAARQKRLRVLVPGAAAPQFAEDPAALLLPAALHELLFLHHPAATRLSEPQVALLRGFALRLSERAAAQLSPAATTPKPAGAALPTGSAAPRELACAETQLLGRHSLLGGLFVLWRADTSVPSVGGAREYRGVPAPVPRLQLLFGRTPRALPERRQVRVLPELLAQPESAAALQALLAASPLTALLPPVGCGLLPALAEHAAWLRLPVVARLVVARYLTLGATAAVAEVGAVVSVLLHQRPCPIPSDQLMTLLCLLSHLHVCAALAQSSSPPTDEAAGTLRDSYALYAALATHWPRLSAPHDVLNEPRLFDRLTTYRKACRNVAGPAAVQGFIKLCQDALVPAAARPDATRSPMPVPGLRP